MRALSSCLLALRQNVRSAKTSTLVSTGQHLFLGRYRLAASYAWLRISTRSSIDRQVVGGSPLGQSFYKCRIVEARVQPSAMAIDGLPPCSTLYHITYVRDILVQPRRRFMQSTTSCVGQGRLPIRTPRH